MYHIDMSLGLGGQGQLAVGNGATTGATSLEAVVSDLAGGWNEPYWSVTQGEQPLANQVGTAARNLSTGFVQGTQALWNGMTGAGAAGQALQAWNQGQYGAAAVYGVQSLIEAGSTVLTGGLAGTATKLGAVGVAGTSGVRGAEAVRVANSGRDALIAESRTQSAYLQGKYGSLSSEQRLARIDELSGANYQRRIGEAIDNQEYVYRYLSETGLSDSTRYGTLRGYTTTELSTSSADVARGAQILPEWGIPKYGVKIPVSDMNGFSIARPMGGKSPIGWEPFTNSYPSAGSGGWSQFLLNEIAFNQANVFKLNP
ncbi:hypothetical protein WAE61_10750 [Comamonadaceae bacterium PP-2]